MNTVKYYSIGETAEILGKTEQTLRNWHKSGKLVPERVDEKTGYRYYSQAQIDTYLNKARLVIGYCRAQSKEDLSSQVEDMRTYLLAKGKPFEILTDIGDDSSMGSGLDDSNIGSGLKDVLAKIIYKEVATLVLPNKYILPHFSAGLIMYIAKLSNCGVEIVDNTDS